GVTWRQPWCPSLAPDRVGRYRGGKEHVAVKPARSPLPARPSRVAPSPNLRQNAAMAETPRGPLVPDRGRIGPMDRRTALGTLAGALLLAPLVATAQSEKVWQVGFLTGGARPPDGLP